MIAIAAGRPASPFRHHRLLLILTAWLCLSFLLIPTSTIAVAGPGHEQDDTPIHPHDATRLYVGHRARLTAQIPASWTGDTSYMAEYAGAGGFVASDAVRGSGLTLQTACTQEAAFPYFGPSPTIDLRNWQGESGCLISPMPSLPHDNGSADLHGFVVRHPRPFTSYGEPAEFVVLYADRNHILTIADSIDFAPERVTPVAYVTSVLDLIEARSLHNDEIDWSRRRAHALDVASRALTLEETYPVILDLLDWLRLAGDRHSYFLTPEVAADWLATDAVGLGFEWLGSVVTLVYPDGPAARAGLRPGDQIERVNDEFFTPQRLWETSGQTTLQLRRDGVASPIVVSLPFTSYDTYLPPTGRRVDGGVGYLELPGVLGTPDTWADYARTVQAVITEIDRQPTCGWIVDLRRNLGGTYVPMVAGVGSILGNGVFAGFQDGNGALKFLSHRDGAIVDQGFDVAERLLDAPLYRLTNPAPPVAVLIGPMTGSSGELTALAFQGRPATRFFGESTAGVATAIAAWELFDGAWLGLAEAEMTDRTGQTYPNGISADRSVATDWTHFGAEEDPAVAAALAWLQQQPACAAT